MKQFFIYLGSCLIVLLSHSTQAAMMPESGAANAHTKAQVVYNLSRFIEWPESSLPEASFFNICILGDALPENALTKLAKKRMRTHEVRFVHLEKAEFDSCHVVFISTSEEKILMELLSLLSERAILSVSDIKDFATQGGGIGLLRTGKQISFEINLQAAHQGGLSIRAPLLELAKLVSTPSETAIKTDTMPESTKPTAPKTK